MLKVKITEEGNWKRALEIEVPTEEVEGELEAAYKRYRRKVQLPGFRRGKAPMELIKARFGKAIEGEVINDIISRAYDDARKENNIDPIAQAVVNEIDYEPGKPLKFKAEVEVRPTIDLKEYKGIEVTRRVPMIREEDVDKALEGLRHRYAEMRTIEGEAEEGHYLVADIQRLDRTGVPLVGDKMEDFHLEIGSSPFGKEFDGQLIGVKPGELRTIKVVRQEEDRPDKRPAEALFSVEVKGVTEKRLPQLDDEFAKDVGDCETLSELREKVAQDLEKMAGREADRMVRREIINTLIHENPFDVPETMVESFLQAVVDDARTTAGDGMDEGAIRKDYRPLAIWQVKKHLILEEIRRREKIEGSGEEMLDFLVENAKIKPVHD